VSGKCVTGTYFVHRGVWPGLATQRSWVRLSAVPLSRDNLRQAVHTRVLLSPSSVNWYRSNGGDAPYDWEFNRSSGVALAVRHRLKWFIHLWTERPTEQDE